MAFKEVGVEIAIMVKLWGVYISRRVSYKERKRAVRKVTVIQS